MITINLCPNLSVAENILIGREPHWAGGIDWLEPLAADPRTRSNTSVCLRLCDPEVTGAEACEDFIAQLCKLLEAEGALDASAIAARFKQGQKVRPAVASVLASLHRTGLVSTPDRGRSFTYRRAA